jgi:hypothetical protein
MRPPALLVVEPIGGLAGDMFLAAALDAGVDRAALEAQLATLGVPGWRLEVTGRTVSGIAATHLEVVVTGAQPAERRLAELLALVDGSGLSPRARATARALLERIGRAEAAVHRQPIEALHLHELGGIDSLVDLCGAVVVLELLGWPRVVAPPPELGRGIIRSAHGPMPVPAPAVLELLIGLPVRPGGPPGEAVTPTGAALLAHFAELGPLPPFVPRRIGYGAGTVTWPDRPNLVRFTLADPAPSDHPAADDDAETRWVVETNLDDCSGQLVARAIEVMLGAGALDAWAAPLTMKKGRPGVLLGGLCDGSHRAAVARAMLTETTTLGVRWHRVERTELAREWHEVETPHGKVRVKVARLDGRETGASPEYEDCLDRARVAGVPVKDVMAAALAAWRGRPDR